MNKKNAGSIVRSHGEARLAKRLKPVYQFTEQVRSIVNRHSPSGVPFLGQIA